MSHGYFHRVARQSPTRLWINNPTQEEARKAIAAGAISCTTNPTYTAKMLQEESEKEAVMGVIDQVTSTAGDDAKAASEIQRQVIKPLVEIFSTLYAKDPHQGFVSIQGDPYAEDDYANIVEAALADRALGENVIAKIPVTAAGLKAIEHLIWENVPIIATEVMAISQATAVCELYERTCARTGRRPPLFVTHITGIFDEYLHNLACQEEIPIAKDILWQAGTIVARKQYKLLKERGYQVTMLGGGARGLHHFTEMVGGDIHVTINWRGAAEELVRRDPPVVYRMDTPIPDYAVNELLRIPVFRMAFEEGGLAVEEFADYGPVRYFRDSFEAGWSALLEAIAARRKEQEGS